MEDVRWTIPFSCHLSASPVVTLLTRFPATGSAPVALGPPALRCQPVSRTRRVCSSRRSGIRTFPFIFNGLSENSFKGRKVPVKLLHQKKAMLEGDKLRKGDLLMTMKRRTFLIQIAALPPASLIAGHTSQVKAQEVMKFSLPISNARILGDHVELDVGTEGLQTVGSIPASWVEAINQEFSMSLKDEDLGIEETTIIVHSEEFGRNITTRIHEVIASSGIPGADSYGNLYATKVNSLLPPETEGYVVVMGSPTTKYPFAIAEWPNEGMESFGFTALDVNGEIVTHFPEEDYSELLQAMQPSSEPPFDDGFIIINFINCVCGEEES